ncbi:MAG: response regulator [Verrucomicrobiales bacterium]
MSIKRILVIDDEPDFTALLTVNLQEVGGYLVRQVNDSAEAVKAAREYRPHLCVIDVVMPGMDGGDIVAKFRTDEVLREIPVMMLTALVEENPDSLDGETLTGGLPFVSKTSDFKTILACIEKHLAEGIV